MIERTGRQRVGHEGRTAVLAEKLWLRRCFARSIAP